MDIEEEVYRGLGECFRLQVYSDHPLNETTVLEYFTHSRFYDKTCNNEKVKAGGTARLEKMTGIEYAVVKNAHKGGSPGDLLTIERRYRSRDGHVAVQAVYYVLHGVVYQAPHLCTVLASRLRKAVHHLTEALDALSHDATLDTSTGDYSWASVTAAGAGSGASASAPLAGAAASASTRELAAWTATEKRRRVDEALLQLDAQFAPGAPAPAPS